MRLVVVGAGIVGAACARTASGLGAEVILVDAGLPGQATSAGAGIICPWSGRPRDPDCYAFACAAAREYQDLAAGLADEGAGDVSYRRVGALCLADGAESLAAASELLLALRTGAPEMGEVTVLDAGQARELFPPLRPDAAAVFIEGAARVDGRLLARALTTAAVARGAAVRQGRAELGVRAGRVTGILLDGEVIEADAVVAATGAWTTPFLAPAGIVVTVRPERGQIAHLRMEPAGTARWPVVLPGGSGHYLLTFDDSRVVAGATREADAGFDPRVTAGGLREVIEQALAVAPGLAAATYLETRVGLRPVSPDARPLLGPVAGTDGLVVATGLGASGLTMGPRAGAIAARAALGLDPGIDLAPFDPLR